MEIVPPASRILRSCLAVIAFACVTSASASAAPRAKISAVDCDAGGAIVTLSNDAGGPVRFVLLRDEAVIATVVVPAGAVQARRVVPIAEGAAAQVTARYGGSYTSGLVRRGCQPETARSAVPVRASTSANVPAAEASPVVPATGTRAALRDAPVLEPRPDRVDRGSVPNVGPSWPVAGFTALAVIALAALARLLSRGQRELAGPTAGRTRRPARRRAW